MNKSKASIQSTSDFGKKKQRMSSDHYFRSLNNPFMEVNLSESSLVNNFAPRGNSGSKNVVNLKLIDPHTNRTLCNIRAPKLKIGRYNEDGARCIDLHRYMRDLNVTPDFGFDADDSIVQRQTKEPWANMLSLLGEKERQKALWSSINEMKEMKANYNMIVAQK